MFQWKFSFLFFSFFPRIFLFFCSLTAHWGFPLGKPLYEALSTVRRCSYKGSSLFAVWPFVYMRKNWFVGHLQALKASRLKIILKYQWCPRAPNKLNNLCCKNCTVKIHGRFFGREFWGSSSSLTYIISYSCTASSKVVKLCNSCINSDRLLFPPPEAPPVRLSSALTDSHPRCLTLILLLLTRTTKMTQAVTEIELSPSRGIIRSSRNTWSGSFCSCKLISHHVTTRRILLLQLTESLVYEGAGSRLRTMVCRPSWWRSNRQMRAPFRTEGGLVTWESVGDSWFGD